MSLDFACKQMAQKHISLRGKGRLEVNIEFGVTPNLMAKSLLGGSCAN